MSTIIRPVVSEKSKYWIERHRYYELKHFCLQYPVWKKAVQSLTAIKGRPVNSDSIHGIGDIPNPTSDYVEKKLYYTERIEMVERVARETSEPLQGYILKAVTEGLAYEPLNAQIRIPCYKDLWYEMYRRFFWLLDQARG